MTTETMVRKAKTPGEALLILAVQIDKIWADIDGLIKSTGTNPWAIPEGGDASADSVRAAPVTVAPSVVDSGLLIEATQLALNTETDPENRLALEAKLRLLKDGPENIPDPEEQGDRPEVEGDEQAVVIKFKPTDDQRKELRTSMAERIFEHDVPAGLSREDTVDAYIKGGPLWLYYGDRDFVMALPPEWRRDMVQDVMIDSAAEALEMGRDVLKDWTPTGMGEAAFQMERWEAAGKV